jgi:hypothetical protein
MSEEVHEKARSGFGSWAGLLHYDGGRLCLQGSFDARRLLPQSLT